MSKNAGGPAYPAQVSINRDSGEMVPHQFGNNDFVMPGMTLRDYFAAKAMQAFISAIGNENFVVINDFRVSERSYEVADAMLAERDK